MTIYPYRKAQEICQKVLTLEKLRDALTRASDAPGPHVQATLSLLGLEPTTEDLGLEPGDSLEEALTRKGLKQRIDELEGDVADRAKYLLRLIERRGLADSPLED